MSNDGTYKLIKRIRRKRSGWKFSSGDQESNAARHSSRLPSPRIGIALGAGAARGWAHIGVIKALKKAGISPDIVAGTSIGAVAGGCFVAGKIDQLEDFARSLSLRRLLSYLDFNFSGSSIINGNRLHKALEMHLETRRIEEFKRSFVSVATELGSGDEIWLKKGSITQAIRASYALPGIFKPVNIKGQWLTDGALVNPIPVSVCRAMGAEIVIAVNLNNDRSGMCAADASSKQRDLRREKSRSEKPCAGAPGIRSVLNDALNITQNSIARARLAYDTPDLTINPQLGKIGMFDFHRAGESIRLGEQAVERALQQFSHRLTESGTGDSQNLARSIAVPYGNERAAAHNYSNQLTLPC